MYEIANLKTKKLQELQEIAKKLNVKNISGLKKLELIYQIIDLEASSPVESKSIKSEKKVEAGGVPFPPHHHGRHQTLIQTMAHGQSHSQHNGLHHEAAR